MQKAQIQTSSTILGQRPASCIWLQRRTCQGVIGVIAYMQPGGLHKTWVAELFRLQLIAHSLSCATLKWLSQKVWNLHLSSSVSNRGCLTYQNLICSSARRHGIYPKVLQPSLPTVGEQNYQINGFSALGTKAEAGSATPVVNAEIAQGHQR